MSGSGRVSHVSNPGWDTPQVPEEVSSGNIICVKSPGVADVWCSVLGCALECRYLRVLCGKVFTGGSEGARGCVSTRFWLARIHNTTHPRRWENKK